MIWVVRAFTHCCFYFSDFGNEGSMLCNSRLYMCFTVVVAATLTVHSLLNYNYCLKDVVTHKFNYTNITRDNHVTKVVHCTDIELERRVGQRGQFLVLENFIMASKKFKCAESITLTAPGDYRFLDNVVPLVDRWRGPISIALYAPGYDFFTTLQCIGYLRTCTTPLVRELVTFHLFFEYDHMPIKNGSTLLDIYKDTFDCSLKPPYVIMADSDMYKESRNLTYPINVARNIARLAAQTHFVFPSDIELYPTRSFIPKFLNYIRDHPDDAKRDAKKVFVLPIFEVLADLEVPENKTQLRKMFRKKQAILFHQGVCSPCHKIPQQAKWLAANETTGLDVFNVTKRQGQHIIWEPFFVCTQDEPLWDERMNWEGQGNKMCQAYALCILDYDFAVLDNAFLIHKPGVKKKKVQVLKHMDEVKKNNKILAQIQKELQNVYGPNKKCKIHNVFKKK